MSEYNVTYDGEFPNACSGTLTIYRDGVEIYSTGCYGFYSTGSAGFDGVDTYVESGRLCFSNDAKQSFIKWLDEEESISKNDRRAILDLVEETLSDVEVCCGGCI